MSEWKIVRIPEVLFYQEGPGVRNSQYTTSGVKLLNVANLHDGVVDLSRSERYIAETEAYGKYNHFLVDEGDFIIASSGIKVEYFEKKMGFVDASQLPLCMNTSTIRFKPLNKSVIHMKYFMYYLKTDFFKLQLEKLITGSAQLNFGPSHLDKISIPLPPLEVQLEISKKLDKASRLIDLRKQQIERMDLMIKSQFIEMFDQSNRLVPLKHYISSLQAGKSLAGTEECDNKVLCTGSVSYDYFNRLDVKNLPPNYTPNEDHRVHDGDVIISRMNTLELVGAAAYVFAAPEKTYLPDRLWKAIISKHNNPLFVWHVLIQPSTKEKIQKAAGGTSGSMKNISKANLLNILVPLVEIDKQNQFAVFVQQVDKSKFDMNQSLERLEQCRNALMQEAFG